MRTASSHQRRPSLGSTVSGLTMASAAEFEERKLQSSASRPVLLKVKPTEQIPLSFRPATLKRMSSFDCVQQKNNEKSNGSESHPKKNCLPLRAFVTPRTPMMKSTMVPSKDRSFSGSASVCSIHEISMVSSDEKSQSGRSLASSPPRTANAVFPINSMNAQTIPRTPPRKVMASKVPSTTSVSPSSTLSSSPSLKRAAFHSVSIPRFPRTSTIDEKKGPSCVNSSRISSTPLMPVIPIDARLEVEQQRDDVEDRPCHDCQSTLEALARQKEETHRLQNLVQELVGLLAKQQAEIERLKGKSV